jgi:dTDP-4-dehydrorhamnose reductase
MLGGRVLAEALARGHEAAGADLPELVLTDPDAVARVVDAHAPEVVIHCAAFTDVDGAEAAPERAMAINAVGTGHLAHAAPYVVAMSSDYVFAGDAARPYVESDPTGPATAYGRSKAAAEERLLAASPRHAVLRAQWLYGAGGRNFVDTILDRAAAGEELRVVADQTGSPTWTGHVAPALLDLAERGAAGIFHASGGGAATWHELAVQALARAGAVAGVTPIGSDALDRPAPRPRFSLLGTERTNGVVLPPWRVGLEAHLAERAA